MTVLAKLLAKQRDTLNYVNYVFECLDAEIKRQSKYILCTQFPNWEARELDIGEIGYLDFVEIQAGIDKWYNGQKMIPYNYNMIQFIKFIPKPEKKDSQYKM